MALNKKIVKVIEDKTKDDPKLRKFLVKYLQELEAGHQAKRILDTLLKEIPQE